MNNSVLTRQICILREGTFLSKLNLTVYIVLVSLKRLKNERNSNRSFSGKNI